MPSKNNTTYYLGAAYEYEFDGDAKATAYGLPIDTPSLKGGTGIFELGVNYKHPGSKFAIDFGIQGYAGKREGFSGRLQFNYEF